MTVSIARLFNGLCANQVVAFHISKTFDRVRNAGLLHKFKSCGISCWVFGLILSFFSNNQVRVVLDADYNTLCPESNLTDSVGSGLLISVLGKLTLFHLIV